MKSFLGKLEFTVEREIVIRAPRTLVFRYFTDSERFARWWGEGSSIEGREGGAVRIVYPGGVVVSGEVLEFKPEERVVFSYGYEGEGKPIAPGASRVTISLRDHPQGTLLSLLHEVAEESTRDHHVQGWRYQMALFAKVAADEAHADVAVRADRWFEAWNEEDADARSKAFGALVTSDIQFQDAHGCTRGREDLEAHVSGARMHMPDMRIERTGEARHCQGTALVDWVVKLPDGNTAAKGTNVFELAPDGRFARVVGLWG